MVMSMLLAGGGLRHGQVIGATESDGGHIKNRPVTPGDLAATIYHHMGVPLDTTYPDGTGRPLSIVQGARRSRNWFDALEADLRPTHSAFIAAACLRIERRWAMKSRMSQRD